MPEILSNFKYKAPLPNFERDQVKDKAGLKSATLNDYDNGHIVFCVSAKKHYYFDADMTPEEYKDPKNSTGYFRPINFNEEDEEVNKQITKSIFIFCSTTHQDEPLKVPAIPSGEYNFSWDVEEDIIISPEYPSGYNGIEWVVNNEDVLDPPVWMCYGVFSKDDPSNPKWNTPLLISAGAGDGVDTDSVEYIYKRTSTPENEMDNYMKYRPVTPPSNNITGMVPDEWTDHPMGVGYVQQTAVKDLVLYDCEWVMVRYLLKSEDGTATWTEWRGDIEQDEEGNYIYDSIIGENGEEIKKYHYIPALWSKYGVNGKDGDGVEYIYTRNHDGIKPSNPTPLNWEDPESDYQTNSEIADFIEGWYDDPQGVDADNEYEWVSVRKYNGKDKKWGRFSDPTLWSKFTKSGQFTSYVFTRMNASQEEMIKYTPLGGSYSKPSPEYYGEPGSTNKYINTIWSDTIKNDSDAQVWMSYHTFDPEKDNESVMENLIVWSTPQLMSDTVDFEVIYSPLKDPVRVNVPNPERDETGVELTQEYKNTIKELGWYDDPEDCRDEDGNIVDAVWMATNNLKSGEWKGWKFAKIKGEQGEAGTAIQILGSYQFVYEEDANIEGYYSTSDKIYSLEWAWRQNALSNGAEEYNPPRTGQCYLVEGDCWVCQLDNESLVVQGKDYTLWSGGSFVELELVWENAGRIKGDPGNGIKDYEKWYAVSDRNDLTDDELKELEWRINSPNTDPVNKYLWKRTRITYDYKVDENDWIEFFELIGTYGDKGIDGDSIEYIYKRTKVESAPNNPTPRDWETNELYQSSDWKDEQNGWYDDPQGVTDEWGFEWISKRIRTWDEEKQANVWGQFSDPSLWSNKAVSVIGARSQYAVSAGMEETDQPSESEWFDYSPAVTNEKPYLWKRSKILFSDGSESDVWTYEVIGKMGDKGIDGESIEYIYMMTKTSDRPTQPSSNDPITTNIAGQWTDDPLTMTAENGYKYQWISEHIKTWDENKREMVWGPYTTPSLWAEMYPGLFIHIKYAIDADKSEVGSFTSKAGLVGVTMKFTSNNGEDVGKYIGVLTDYNEGDSDNGEDYQWKKFEGEDGFAREYIFKLSDEGDKLENAPLLPAANDPDDDQYCPSGWSRDPISPNATRKYCWACHRDKEVINENGIKVWSNWKGTGDSKTAYLFSMFAESVPGATGKQGPILYPEGYWDSRKTYSQKTKEVEMGESGTEIIATATPYVLYDDEFYVLNVVGPVNSTPASDSISWLKMDKFDAIYTEILLANNALVGSAVFNGDYIFSQQGIGSGSYENFNHDSPYASGNVFKPNWCVNLKTGEMWTGAGKSHFASDGSGFLANENISWDTNGNLIIGGNEFNNDGSGSLANGKISWESDGEAVIGGFKINNSSIGLSDKTFRRWAEINTDGTFTFGTQQSGLFGTDISDISFDGEMLTIEKSNLGGSNNVPTTNAFMISHGNVVFRVSNAGVYANKNGKEYDLLSLLDKVDDLEDSTGVQFVGSIDSIPSDAKEGTLYIV